MKRDSVLFLGSGDLGQRAGGALLDAGMTVAGARRDPARLPAGFQSFTSDYLQPATLGFIPDLNPSYIVTCFKPTTRDLAGYRAGFVDASRNLLAALGSCQPRRLLFVSSTRVFAEQDGGWVTEDSPRAESDPAALAMIEAEQLLAAAVPTTAIYFSGIDGDPQGRLLSRISRGELAAAKPGYFSNRIHREDAGAFIAHLLLMDRADNDHDLLAPAYIGSDNLPALQHEVEYWLAEQMGVMPSGEGIVAPRMSPGHKRCNNSLLRASGFALRYPDYRSGYAAVLARRTRQPG